MNFETLKLNILLYIDNFGMYDYIAYAWLILIFFFTILLSIVLARRAPLIGILLFIISLGILFVGPFILKSYLDNYLRSNEATVLDVKKLNFSNMLIVSGTLQNQSELEYKICNIDINIYKAPQGFLDETLGRLKPFANQSILLEQSVQAQKSVDFRVVFNNYTYTGEINATAKASCY